MLPTSETLVFIGTFFVFLAITGIILMLRGKYDLGLALYSAALTPSILVTIVAKGIAKTDGQIIFALILVLGIFLAFLSFLNLSIPRQEGKQAAA